jgi:hypothetical protein
MHMQHKIFLIVVMLLPMFLFSCTNEVKSPVPGASPQQQEGERGVSVQSSEPQQSSGMMVRILPEPPTVTADLQIVHSGHGKILYEWQRNGLSITEEQTDRLAKHLFVKGDTIVATVRADNATGSVSVVIANSPPRVESVPFNPGGISAGIDLAVKPVGFDADGDMVEFHYKWSVNGREQPEDSSVLPGNRFRRGDTVALTVIPYDREGEGQPFVSQPIVIPDAVPRITSSPPQNFQGDVYTYQVIAHDPDGDPITYSLVSAPAGMIIDSRAGLITWQLNPQSAGSHQVEVVAAKPGGMKGNQRYTLTITFGGAK